AGNLHEHSFQEIWRNSILFDYYRSMGGGACSGCGQYNTCHGGCPATRWFVHQRLNIKDPECVLP
ncbi:MAG TPA: SPASM domain-containing protein, partial [Ktedonobacteraceae bacterium]|nr:SPASM domain-containing protein [Ktedonobacteraceae bacterium]